MIETVEQDQSIGTGPVELSSDMGNRREERRELDGHRDRHGLLHLSHGFNRLALDIAAGRLGIGCDAIEVQLERVSASLRHQPRIFDPATRRRAVERRHDRNADRFLRPSQMFQVLVRAQREGVRAGKVAGRLGERFAVGVEIEVLGHLLVGDLLFEERSQDDGRGAGVFEALDAVEVVGER